MKLAFHQYWLFRMFLNFKTVEIRQAIPDFLQFEDVPVKYKNDCFTLLALDEQACHFYWGKLWEITTAVTLLEVNDFIDNFVGYNKTEVTRKQSTPNFPKNKHFLPPGTPTYVCISGNKKCSFFRKFGELCFLVTSVLRIALLVYHRRLDEFLWDILIYLNWVWVIKL